jgi:hypothetical protein
MTGLLPLYEISQEVSVIINVINGRRPARPAQTTHSELTDSIWLAMQRCWSGDPSQRLSLNTLADVLNASSVISTDIAWGFQNEKIPGKTIRTWLEEFTS